MPLKYDLVPKNGNGNGKSGNGTLLEKIELVKEPLSPLKAEVGDSSTLAPKQSAGANGVSRFVESLIRKNIVSAKTVADAAAWKKMQGENEKRPLFQVLIEKYEIDREEVYTEFVSYYSFRSIELASIEVTGDK